MATIAMFCLVFSVLLLAFANIGLWIDNRTWRRRYREIEESYAKCMKERR